MIVCKKVSRSIVDSFMEDGFALTQTKNEYEILRLQKEAPRKATLIFYTSGKVLIQCKEEDDAFYKRLALEKSCVVQPPKKSSRTRASASSEASVPNSSSQYFHNVIGSDETLKGDSFGGLIVVAAYFSKAEEQELLDLGVKDSKLLSDDHILRIAEELEKNYPDKFSIKEYSPLEYNKAVAKMGGVTPLLNKAHEETGNVLKNKFGESLLHIVDEYPGCVVGDKRLPRAESKSLAVAAASIVARARAIEQFNELSKEAGFHIPKGSTHVKEAIQLLIHKNLPVDKFLKLHFKNVQKIISDNEGVLFCRAE